MLNDVVIKLFRSKIKLIRLLRRISKNPSSVDNVTKLMKFKKYTYISLGWLSFTIGLIGVFLPLLPTVVFWIIAAWLWSKGSPELKQKVYQHHKYGLQIEAFMQHGVVPRKGKTAAVISMTISYLLFQVMIKPTFFLGLIVAMILTIIALWLISRPELPIKNN